MEHDPIFFPYLISNIVAIGMAISAMIWIHASRLIYSIVFIAAAIVNSITVLVDPTVYLSFGELTTNSFYRSFILGPFSKHIQVYVGMIALGQFLVGLLSAYRGNVAKYAMYGGIVFLVAIAPLGIGSAFPSTLIMATGYFILVRRRHRLNLYEIVHRKSSYSRVGF